ncbi:beta-propeller fold lactonase family protein [Actinomadura sp. LD22]|uniref:Beta-propeller fold lactonase family protein n=1 Tax=Actinomadura physcomitrii TaxID=2650748 RepID=A0A6I4MAR8_9ACTN|nr:lactonase family protein [Actinomadura physcomitrii]MVZ99738.1 beta-propeller fold lactonase family protein [Actinomadura physcomitrii]
MPDSHPSRRTVLGAAAAAAAAPLLAGVPAARAAARRGDLLFVSPWKGTQIYGARFDAGSGALTSLGPVGDAPSNWTAPHPAKPLLYVGSSEDGGIVHTYAVDRATGALTRTGTPVRTDGGGTAGGGISYLGVDRPSRTLLVANFEAGLAASLPLAKGLPGTPASVVADTGSGPNPRQNGPHVHHVTIDPSGRRALVADFGADRVFVRGFDRSTGAITPGSGAYASAPGSGPRRILFHPRGRTAYVLNELSGDLETLGWHDGTLTPRQRLALDSGAFTGAKSGAELALSGDGRFVYASSRGENVLVVFAADGRTGLLRLVQRVPSGGLKPWSFTLHRGGGWLLAANQASDTVTVFAVDRRKGTLSAAGAPVPFPAPACLTFFDR